MACSCSVPIDIGAWGGLVSDDGQRRDALCIRVSWTERSWFKRQDGAALLHDVCRRRYPKVRGAVLAPRAPISRSFGLPAARRFSHVRVHAMRVLGNTVTALQTSFRAMPMRQR